MSSVFTTLQAAGIEYKIVEHPALYTVADGTAHLPDSYPVKNLLLQEEKGHRCVLVVMKGDERLDTKFLQNELGCKKLRFAKPEMLMDRLGVEPGSASLFCLLHTGSASLEVVIDQRLINQSEVGFHPSLNTQTIYISGQDVITFLSFIGRTYRVLSIVG